MWVSIGIWAVVSFLLGWSACTWIAPATLAASAGIFVTPFIFLGLQYSYFNTKDSWRIFGKEFWAKEVSYRQLTVWGRPVGSRETMETQHLILPCLTPEDVRFLLGLGRMAPVVLIPVFRAVRRIIKK